MSNERIRPTGTECRGAWLGSRAAAPGGWRPPFGGGQPAEAAGKGQDHVRASDSERQATADQLKDHFAAGRLDIDEFDERMQRALGPAHGTISPTCWPTFPRQARQPLGRQPTRDGISFPYSWSSPCWARSPLAPRRRTCSSSPGCLYQSRSLLCPGTGAGVGIRGTTAGSDRRLTRTAPSIGDLTSQAWVHPRPRDIQRAQLAQEGQQLRPLGRLEVGAQCLLDAEGDLVGLFQHPPAVRGQYESVSPTVGWVRPASYELETFEIVYQRDHPVGMDPESGTDGPLRLALTYGEGAEQTEVTRLDAKGC